jgi:hypothetical protein
VLEVAGQTLRIAPGDKLVIPPRTPHGFKDAAEEAQLLVEVRPALHLDDYFRTFLGLSRDGRISMPSKGLPHPLLRVALVMERYAPEIAARASRFGCNGSAGGCSAQSRADAAFQTRFPNTERPDGTGRRRGRQPGDRRGRDVTNKTGMPTAGDRTRAPRRLPARVPAAQRPARTVRAPGAAGAASASPRATRDLKRRAAHAMILVNDGSACGSTGGVVRCRRVTR